MMNTKKNYLHKQGGLSLVEIMVALVISLFLLGGVIQVYIGNKTSYRFADASARIQENARFALETIASDSRMAGYWGCAQYASNDTSNLVNNLNLTTNALTELYDFVNNPAISATVNDGLNGSDSITISGSKANQNSILAPYMANTEDGIEVSADSAITTGDIVILSNCKGADIFEVTSISKSTINGQKTLNHAKAGTIGNVSSVACAANKHCLSQLYDSSSAITSLQTVTYTVAAGASGEPALWRSVNGVNEELIEGIEQMQILFGIDTDSDGSPNQYVSSDKVTDPLQISAMRVFLVLRSDVDGITDSPQVYSINGVNSTAADNRLRRVFSVTISLRNRV